ncbi:MAG TPA: hypothetical protein VG944_03345 [Fimbriimonas sp.]|nr:hypothetical protein [Fimbriimonas sp.]
MAVSFLAALSASSLLTGCGQHDPLPFPTYAAAYAEPPEPGNVPENAYIQAASALDSALGAEGPQLLNKTSFTPGERTLLKEKAKDAIHLLRPALNQPGRIPSAPADSTSALRYRSEWRMIGRVLVWDVQDAVAHEDYTGATQYAVLASKFGFDLTSGTPRDASLGFVTVDSARRALTPAMEKMSGPQLATLATAMKTVLLGRPPLSNCLANASRDMMQTVQDVQDAYRNQDYTKLQSQLGAESKDIVAYLKDLHSQSDLKRSQFFEGFAAEARAEANRVVQNAEQPAVLREAPPKAPRGERPWKRLSQRYFGLGDPILHMSDATCARTKLLVLEAEILRSLKVDGQTPKDLSGFSHDLTIDPYSGQQFLYRTDGKDYRLYSVGDDFADNDGETDETFTRPDLMLEKDIQ